MIDDLTFLEEGKLTQRTDLTKRVAEKIRNYNPKANPYDTRNGVEYQRLTPPERICDFITHKLRHNANVSEKDLFESSRTGSQVIESGFWYGCTDRAKAFRVLAIELGIPTKYVETFSQEWLDNPNPRFYIQGHAFNEVLTDGIWKVIDPLSGFTLDNKYYLDEHQFKLVGKGLDPTEVYVFKDGVPETEPRNLQDLREIAKMFKPLFR